VFWNSHIRLGGLVLISFDCLRVVMSSVSLSEEESYDLMCAIIRGEVSESVLCGLMVAFEMKGIPKAGHI
jgi:anthranilate phosphoribosyltransferase